MTESTAPRHPAYDDLLSRWTALLDRAREGAPEPPARPYGEQLLARWAEPHRHYHTLNHLREVLDRATEISAHCPTLRDPDAVLLALWFHDAAYRPDRSENEERSAQLAERALREAGLPAALVAEVARLVRLTVDHDPWPGDIEGKVVSDADLAVLAGSPQSYASFTAGVREEYAFVPDDAFREGRTAVLRRFLARPRIFRTDYAHHHWERTARFNLTTELDLLTR